MSIVMVNSSPFNRRLEAPQVLPSVITEPVTITKSEPTAQDAPHPAAAVVSLPIGPRALAQPFRAIVAFRMTESEAQKYGLGDRWRAAMKRRLEIAARKSSVKAQLKASVLNLLNHAEAVRVSQREMTRKAGLSWGSFRRCRDGRASPATWLPKLKAALTRLDSKES